MLQQRRQSQKLHIYIDGKLNRQRKRAINTANEPGLWRKPEALNFNEADER
jgi:hypothetical protein